MTDYEIHAISYSGTTTADWSAPRESDFGTDDLDPQKDGQVKGVIQQFAESEFDEHIE